MKPVGHMDKEMRAKQFMPFAALKGFDAAIRAREQIIVPRAELSEESKDELDRKFHLLQKGQIITVTYYDKRQGKYLKKEGLLAKIEPDARLIRLVNTKISFEDIYAIDL